MKNSAAPKFTHLENYLKIKHKNNTAMISIVIPAFNEEKRIGSSLKKLAKFLSNRPEVFEVIVVNDASTDRTEEVARSFSNKFSNFRLINLKTSPHGGKGLAVNKGVLAAKGDIVVFTDADFSTPINELDKLLNKLHSGFDIAIGSRALDRTLVKTKQSFIRESIGKIFNLLVRKIIGTQIKDTQCGFKAFNMPVSKDLFEKARIFDFGFDVELLYLAKRKGLKIAEVPVIWYNFPESRVHPIKDSIAMFLDLFKIRLYHAQRENSAVELVFYYLYHYQTFIRFSTVGVSNTIVDFGVFYLLTRFIHLDTLTANPISVEIAIVWSFTWNSVWTFSKRKTKKTLVARFLIFQFVSLGALILSQNSLFILNRLFGWHDLFAKAATIPVVLAFNYLMNSRWTFRGISAGTSMWRIYISFVLTLFILYLFLTLYMS